jgi:hypothetical protein
MSAINGSLETPHAVNPPANLSSQPQTQTAIPSREKYSSDKTPRIYA